MISKVTVQEFENGVKVKLDPIEPAISVYVFLPEEGTYRFAGDFDPNDGTFFMKRWLRHKHNVLNSFGISDYVIKMLEPLGLKLFILYIEDTHQYFKLTLEKLKIEATWKYWKDQGFDRQAFVPITLWSGKGN